LVHKNIFFSFFTFAAFLHIIHIGVITMSNSTVLVAHRGRVGKKTKAKQPKTKQTKRTQQTNNEDMVISWSVHNVGNFKKGDSIVSSMVSSSGLECDEDPLLRNDTIVYGT